MSDGPPVGTLPWLATKADFSLLSKLKCEPDYEKFQPNRKSRQVFTGHYVPVKPTPLPNPYLVSYSLPMAAEIGLTEEECKTDRFKAFFSGDIDCVPGYKSWATPYALSIYGQEMYQNCPFNTGNGYGDGRAISVAEVVVNGNRWELQLKGGGKTPFCRSGDGRAVLRSSVREFLASEAMYHLGVPTTRALSLVASATEKVHRPWYTSESSERELPEVDDPRLLRYPAEVRPMIIAQLKEQLRQPDSMVLSTCAITCRTSPSFLRVGQVELFGRRAIARSGDAKLVAKKELEMIVEHVMFREFPHLSPDVSTTKTSSLPLQDRVLLLLEEISQKIAELTANWIRVGYTQGNFNSDNCLVGGRTMDYGPFGFIERFEFTWNMWLGGGKHFSFMNQPIAGAKNFNSLVEAVVPLLDEEYTEKARAISNAHVGVAKNALNSVWAAKLGIPGKWNPTADDLIDQLLVLMEQSEADYTLIFRQLAEILENCGNSTNIGNEELLYYIQDCFYKNLSDQQKTSWVEFLRKWMSHVRELSEGKSLGEISSEMKLVSPKFVPREWMLVLAYNSAEKGDFGPLQELQKLFQNPYGTKSGNSTSTSGNSSSASGNSSSASGNSSSASGNSSSASGNSSSAYESEMTAKYYRKAKKETYCGIGLGGTAYMT